MDEDIQPVIDTGEVGSEQHVDTYEQQAKEQGWKPKEEYQGDPAKWRPAKEFVDRGELFSKIDTMGKELKETKKALAMLQEHHSKVREVEYNKALTELKTLQKKHLEEGNSDGYLETTELLTDLKAEQKAREVVKEVTPQQQDPRFIAWVDENKWYQKDDEMRQFADSIGMGYAQTHPNQSPEEVLFYVTKQVKERFKDKFINPNRSKPGAVGTSDTNSESKGSFQLTEDERRVMNTFIRAGVMTKDNYINEVKKTRGV
jgi:hypothetical protein